MMGMVISLLNQKGGVGKTTLAVHLAMALSQRDERVLLLDADVQGSALDWAASRETPAPFAVLGLPKPALHKEIPRFLADYQHVIIDGPPRVYDVARSAILASDCVLVPIQPSPYDIWAARDIVDLVEEASAFNETLQSAFVINRKIVNTAIGRDVVEALSAYAIPVLDSQICQRVAFAESAASGSTVLEDAPKSAAALEISAVADELLIKYAAEKTQ